MYLTLIPCVFQRQSLCKRSPNSVFVAPPQNQCSRQGLLCDQSGQPLSFVCPFGQILDPIFLSCITDQNRCSRVPKAVSSTVKNSLLRQHCSRKTVVDSFVPGDSAHTDYGTCDTWYIDCRVHFQALIHCEPGRLYDPYMKMCRLSSYHDQCRLATSCLGYEWNILPAGRCKTEFVFCEGLNPKKFVCDHGKVFHKGKCVSLEHSECPLCELGETKASTECSKVGFGLDSYLSSD
ncbi:hypothetical protein L596_008510 [Steinernema carpocapsae]|uniref:Chitin-binding type-2 domain-containing protein n=1 Tax=Steinernema carpocapsae TaxID=34508 RepID=A0A4U5PDS2_STECR|nr:hypothetical protein L596_008510 [Steinernema carpocapsae]